MMRQIRFRGKRKDTGEWVFGDLLHIDGGSLIYFGSQTETETPYIENSSPIAVELFKTEIAVVDPETVGQFTGLYDKNGKEIYEGDIVSGLKYEDFDFGKDGSVNSIVGWRNDTCSFELVAVNGLRMSLSDGLDIEVIGNIHDNIELLNEK